MTSTTHAPDVHASTAAHGHALRLWPFFLALLALTAAEVGLYEWWRSTAVRVEGAETTYAIPKFTLVLLILVFTLPKAYIVLVYFMHLRFEKALVIWLAVVPLMMTFLAVLPTLTDTATLKSRKLHRVGVIGVYEKPHHGDEGHKEGAPDDPAHGPSKAKPAPVEESDYQ